MASLIATKALELIAKRCQGQISEAQTKAQVDTTRSSYWYGKVAAYEDVLGMTDMALTAIGEERP